MFEKCKSINDIDWSDFKFDESKLIDINKAFPWLVGGEWPTIFDKNGYVKQELKE